MLAKRVIPCLDVDAGRVVKGTRFQDLRDAGDPVELAARYDRDGADELVFLDITATVEGRAATLDVISRVAEQVFIPLTVGGGVQRRGRRERPPARRRRQGGAEQRRRARARAAASDAPTGSARSASSIAIDAKRSGRPRQAGRSSWTRAAPAPAATPWRGPSRPPTERGAGEVLLTSMDRDGTGEGYDLELLRGRHGGRRGAGDRERRRRRARRTSPRRSRGGRRRAGGEPPARRRPVDPRDQGAPAPKRSVTVRR